MSTREPEAGRFLPDDVARSLWWPLLLWAIGSGLAVLAAGSGLRGGLGVGVLAGLIFGLAAAQRARSHRRRRRSSRPRSA